MVQPICVPCGVAMRCAKNGFAVKDPVAGQFPSTYWRGDKWRCPDCGTEVVVGLSKEITHDKAVAIGIDKEALEFHYS